MSGNVFVVSEWLPKKGHEQDLWRQFQALLSITKEKESGCVRAHVTRQIAHTGSPGKSIYTIILLQEYVDIESFDLHCSSDYVKKFISEFIDNGQTSIVSQWTCRLFSECA